MIFNLFLTGPRGAGKTTILFSTLRARRLSLGGLVVKKVYQGGRRKAMRIIDLATKDWATLATFGDDDRPQLHLEAFLSIGLPAIERAVAHADVVVLDELGRFELRVPPFMTAVERALAAPIPVTGVIKAESNCFLDSIVARHDTLVKPVYPQTRASVATCYALALDQLLQRSSRR